MTLTAKTTTFDYAAAKRRAALRAKLDALDALAKETALGDPSTFAVRWLALANKVGVSLHTVQLWARQGRVPGSPAMNMELLFGKAAVTKAFLTGER